MASLSGTVSVNDLLAEETVSVLDYGMDTIAQVVRDDLNNISAVVNEELAYIASPTTERAARYGASSEGEMYEGDEFDQGLAQKVSGSYEVGFPLRSFKRNVGWTMKAMKIMTVADLMRQYDAIRKGYVVAIQRELQRRLYLTSNYTYVDKFVDHQNLYVKALLNADSATIPNGPFGETFDGSSHSHYNGVSSLSVAGVQATILDVLEHTADANIVIIIAQANYAAFAALANFIPAALPTTVYASDTSRGITTLDLSQNNNRLVGYFDGYPVWVKPWAVASYTLVLDLNGERPLKKRERPNAAQQGLQMNSQSEIEPLRVDFFEAEFGFGAWRRDGAAILYSGNATYANPTITAAIHT